MLQEESTLKGSLELLKSWHLLAEPSYEKKIQMKYHIIAGMILKYKSGSGFN